MPNKCWVPKCKTNSALTKIEQEEKDNTGELNEKEKYSVFRFPNDPDLKASWLRNIKRDKAEPTQNAVVCARHFTDDCFHSAVTNARGGGRCRISLKKNAVPTLFPDYPSYYASIHQPQERSTTKTGTLARFEADIQRFTRLEEEFMASDKFSNLEELHDKLLKDPLHADFLLTWLEAPNNLEQRILVAYSLELFGNRHMPNVLMSISIYEDGSFKWYKRQSPIGKCKARDVIANKRDKFQTVSQVRNAMALLASMEADPGDKLKQATDALNDIDVEALPTEQRPTVCLCKTQLQLCQANKFGRRLNSKFMLQCVVWQRMSPKLYRNLIANSGLILPSMSKCEMVTRVDPYKGGIDPETEAAFRAICRQLHPKDRILQLGIDEVHTTQMLELCGGNFRGLTDEGEIAKVMLSVHASSACGKFGEMVSMTPRVSSQHEDVANALNSAMMMLTNAGFRIFTITFDRHRINQSYYASLNMSPDEPSIPNPAKPEERVFPMFDSIHLFKNAYYHLLNKKCLMLPRCPGSEEPNRERLVKMDHLNTVYEWEKYRGLKCGFKMTKKCLAPTALERQSVSLAMTVTDPYTIASLRQYAKVHNKDEYNDTADFLEMIRRWINILNVRGPYQDERWNDPYRCVIRPEDKHSEKNLQFLLEVGHLMKDWFDSDPYVCRKIAKPTAYGIYYTSIGEVAAARYIFQQKIDGLNYLCLGKCNSEANEHAFGDRRTMCGSNYWTSVNNFCIAQRLHMNINVVKLVGFIPDDIKADLKEAKQNQAARDEVVIQELAEDLAEESRDLIKDDMVIAAIGNYSGYLAHIINRRDRLSACCKQALVQENEELVLTVDERDMDTVSMAKYHALISLVDREKLEAGDTALQYPSLAMAHMVSFSASVWEGLMCSTKQRRIKFLSVKGSNATAFNELLRILAEGDPDVMQHACHDGHVLAQTVLPVIGRNLFNGFGANFARDVTSDSRDKTKPSVGWKRRGDGSERLGRSREDCKRRKLQGLKKAV